METRPDDGHRNETGGALSSSYPPAGGARLNEFLDGLPILTRWLPGHRIVWQTGQQSGPKQIPASHHTHCRAFAAAVALYLDIYLLRPPQHGQAKLANAQTFWLSGEESFPGIGSAGDNGWTTLGMSGDPGAPAACQQAANAGRLVLVCYAAPVPTHRHVAIVRSRADESADIPPDGPDVIMAGAHNYRSTSMRHAFKNHPQAWPDNLALFAHDTPLQRDPSA
jgi:hypothetical protein